MLFWGWSFENHTIVFEDKLLVITCEFSSRIKKSHLACALWLFI